MENIKIIISLLATSISFLATTILFIMRFIKCIRTKKEIENKEEFLSCVGEVMEIAESFKNYTGIEKKEYVLTKLNQYAIQNHLEFDVEDVSNKIEEIIKLSKSINRKEE